MNDIQILGDFPFSKGGRGGFSYLLSRLLNYAFRMEQSWDFIWG
jgi:hypothetical protein